MASKRVKGASYSGILPPALELKRYEQVYPGFAERIVRMAERQVSMAESQTKHRQELETTGILLLYLRLASGFLLAVGGLFAGAYLIGLGRELDGATAFIASLATLVGLFVYERKR